MNFRRRRDHNVERIHHNIYDQDSARINDDIHDQNGEHTSDDTTTTRTSASRPWATCTKGTPKSKCEPEP